MIGLDDPAELRRARALMLLEAAEGAGLAPISVKELHSFAYLANVLSPVWDMLPQKRTVVHKQGGPYYPELQEDIDAMVGRGIVGIENVEHKKDADKRWRLKGSFYLAEPEVTKRISSRLRQFSDELKLFTFYRELAFAFATVPKDLRSQIVGEDAVYDVDVGEEVVIDFAEWKQENFAENAARHFDQVMPDGRPATEAQKLHLYAHHLRRRLVAGV